MHLKACFRTCSHIRAQRGITSELSLNKGSELSLHKGSEPFVVVPIEPIGPP